VIIASTPKDLPLNFDRFLAKSLQYHQLSNEH